MTLGRSGFLHRLWYWVLNSVLNKPIFNRNKDGA